MLCRNPDEHLSLSSVLVEGAGEGNAYTKHISGGSCLFFTYKTYVFGTLIYHKMIPTVMLANTSIISHSYRFSFVVSTIKM